MQNTSLSLKICFLLLCSSSLFSQQNDIYQSFHFGNSIDMEMLGSEYEKVFASYRKSIFGESCFLTKLDENYLPDSAVYVKLASMAKMDQSSNYYTLSTADFSTDIYFDPLYFTFEKYDTELNHSATASIDSLPRRDLFAGVNGGFRLYEDFAQIYFGDYRVKCDLNTMEITEVKFDNYFFLNILSAEPITDSSTVVSSSGKFSLVDKDGVWLKSTEDLGMEFCVVKDGLAYGNSSSNIYVFDHELNLIETIPTSLDLEKIDISYNGRIFIGANDKLIEVNTDSFTVEIVYENNYDDKIISGFEKTDGMGLLVNKEENIYDDFYALGHETARALKDIEVNNLADVNLKEIRLVDEVLTLLPGSGVDSYKHSFKVGLMIENNGTEILKNIHVLINGDCINLGFFNYCFQEEISGLDIAPGESSEVIVSSLWDNLFFVYSADASLELCVSIVNPNNEYDQNYANNYSCDLQDYLINVEELLKGEDITLYPNPTQTILSLDLGNSNIELNSLEIWSVDGTQLKDLTLANNSSSKIEIATHDFPNGIYLLKGSSTDGLNFVKRFLVVK